MNNSFWEDEPRFLVDAMLGPLCKWLRFMGFDTICAADESDYDLAVVARRDERIIVTRDKEFTRRSGIRYLLIRPGSTDEQLRQIARELRLPKAKLLSRCPNCNADLVSASLAMVVGKIHPSVASKYTSFKVCQNCDSIYWRGEEWQRILATLERLNLL
jgi:hypothetical protein